MTICDILEARCRRTPDRLSHAFLEDRGRRLLTLTYLELYRHVQAVARQLCDVTEPQEAVGCLFQPGLDFVAAFFGCLWAGRTAVPLAPPRPRQGLTAVEAIVGHAGVRTVLTNTETAALLERQDGWHDLQGIRCLQIDGPISSSVEPPKCRTEDVAFLQYTSGSTGNPKGVIIGHDNLMANSAQIADVFGHSEDSTGVIWLPPHHDMGLVGGIVQPLYAGFPVYLMSPTELVRSPATWLAAISRFRATTSGGPNFGYEACVARIPAQRREEFDLSSWEVAFCGAEPVSLRTLNRFADAFEGSGFRASALMPCYGLAEATLMVAAATKGGGAKEGRPDDRSEAPEIAYASCGPASTGQIVSVRGPSGRPLRDGTIGRVWVEGPNVARGYRSDPAASRDVFGAAYPNPHRELRTGDLGFLRDGELHICGRERARLIIRGINHLPEDLEQTASTAHAAAQTQRCLAATIATRDGERLVLLQEVRPDVRNGPIASEVVDAIVERVAAVHGITANVYLLAVGDLPRTRSGKLRRDFFADPGSGVLDAFLAERGASAGRSVLERLAEDTTLS